MIFCRRQKEKRINPPSSGMASPSPSGLAGLMSGSSMRGGGCGGGDGGGGNSTPIPATPTSTAAMLASIASITPPSSLTGLGSSPLSPDPPTPPNVPLSLVTTAHSYVRAATTSPQTSPASSPLPLSLTYNPRMASVMTPTIHTE